MKARNFTIEKQKHCPYCNVELYRKYVTIDHILPKNKGGLDIENNKIYCCIDCNYAKSDMLPLDFIAYLNGFPIKLEYHSRFRARIKKWLKQTDNKCVFCQEELTEHRSQIVELVPKRYHKLIKFSSSVSTFNQHNKFICCKVCRRKNKNFLPLEYFAKINRLCNCKCLSKKNRESKRHNNVIYERK